MEQRIKEIEKTQVEGSQPNIEGLSDYVCCEIGSFSNPLNFADRDGFQTRFSKEAEFIAKLQEIIDQGEQFMHTIYTYRSVSRAVPQVKTEMQNKNELYQKICDCMSPEIKKISNLIAFYEQSVHAISSIFTNMVAAEKRKEIVSDSFLDHLIKTLDMILKLDALKNMKAALNNDFSYYRRAIQITQYDSSQLGDTNHIYQFLSNNNSIINGLKTSLSRIGGVEDILVLLINRCVDNFENKRYLFCNEKHCLLRVCAFGLYLLKGPNKGLNMSTIMKLFKRYPVVPLYADMTYNMKTILTSISHINKLDWQVVGKAEAALEPMYLLIHQIGQIRHDFNLFTSKFQMLINRIKKIESSEKPAIPETLRKEAKDLCEQGMRLLADWTTKILEQAAWKYAHPADISKCEIDSVQSQELQDQQKEEMGLKNEDQQTNDGEQNDKPKVAVYERVIKYNYTAEEKAALVDTIAMIKGLEKLMMKHTGTLIPLIKGQIHHDLQVFIQHTIANMLFNTKKKKRGIHNTLLELRNLAADWKEKYPPDIKKFTSKDPLPEIPTKSVGPSFTQLHMIRTIVSSLYSDRSPGMQKKGLFSEKDFSDKDVKKLVQFYEDSFMWSYLLNYNGVLRKASDLADLWYREFYLEISRRIQFPIKMSLPWMLTEDIIEHRNTTLMETIIYPLDLYNDAASRALYELQRRYLYDEIEAEVNLVFDQLVYKLSEQIYAYYKIVASNILLDNKFRLFIEKLQKVSRFNVPKSRYDVLLKQKYINLLGRSVDLNFLIGQRINITIRENLLKVIQKFESQDITTICELESLIDNVRMTHYLLSEHLTLDDFDFILNEVNESLSMVSFEGRIARHITEELVQDVFPTFIFNTVTQRFVRGPNWNNEINEEYERDKPPRIPPFYQYGSRGFNNSYNNLNEQYKTYFGTEHIHAITRLVGQDSIAIIIETCIAYIEDKLYNELSPYIKALMKAIPPQVKLQPAAYGLYGIHQYFVATFRDFIAYKDLKPQVFQRFRIIGNAIAFLLLLDGAQLPTNIRTYLSAAPFIGLKPLTKKARQKRLDDNEIIETAESQTQVSEIFTRIDDPLQTPMVQKIMQLANTSGVQFKSPGMMKDLILQGNQAAKLYTPSKQLYSLFKQVLERITTFQNNIKDEWKGGHPADRLTKLDSSREFYRLWGILQFIFCMESEKNELYSDMEKFGHGFLWGGCTIVYLFGQHHRFNAFNFSDHVLNIHAMVDKGSEKIPGFLENATEIRSLNDRIFMTLKTYFNVDQAPIEKFTPPENDDFIKNRVVSQFGEGQVNITRSQSVVSLSSNISTSSTGTTTSSPVVSQTPRSNTVTQQAPTSSGADAPPPPPPPPPP